jgi:DNA-binding HxlR family transcriptional regulator
MQSALRMTGSLEPRASWTAERCTMARTLDLLGARSSFLILREAFYGTTRFDDFVVRTGLSEPVTSARLRDLADEGLIEREDYREPGQRTRQQYRLTEKGSELLPVLVALMQWGDRWLDERGGPVALLHRDCGASVAAELRCAAGHRVSPEELDLAVRDPRAARPAALKLAARERQPSQ